jgi:hypothetical protein
VRPRAARVSDPLAAVGPRTDGGPPWPAVKFGRPLNGPRDTGHSDLLPMHRARPGVLFRRFVAAAHVQAAATLKAVLYHPNLRTTFPTHGRHLDAELHCPACLLPQALQREHTLLVLMLHRPASGIRRGGPEAGAACGHMRMKPKVYTAPTRELSTHEYQERCVSYSSA